MSDKLTHDIVVMARLIKDESDRVRDENARLKDENAKLCKQGERLFDKTLELATENAKLREVAGKTWRLAERLCHAIEGPCQGDESCPLGERDEECVYGLIQFELRELGVEVAE